MAYVIERFGAITLPTYNTTYTSDPVPTDESALVAFGGGVFDGYGDERGAQKYPLEVTYQAIVADSVATTWQTTLAQLRAAVGLRGRLYRRDQSNVVHWCEARLMAMPYARQHTQKQYTQIEMKFWQLSPWHGSYRGAGWALDAGEILDNARVLDETPPTTLSSNPQTVTVNNGGNYPVSDVTITVVAGSADITYLQITGPDVDLQWLGMLAAGKTLVIDCAAWSVLNDSANAYNGLSFGSLHRLAGWMELAPGSTGLVVSRTGGGSNSTISIVFSDGMA